MLFPERRIDLVLYIQSLRECLPEQLAFESDYWAWVVSCVSFLCARQAYQYLFFDDQLLHHCHHLALRKNRHFLVYWALYQACH